MKCSVSYCWEKSVAREMCSHHYNQNYPRRDTRLNRRNRAALAKRLESKGFSVSDEYLDQRLAGLR
ncbi:Uncharacterised protein [Mycobacteroides abscessus subsp. abscessus]|uniref:Regulatory protein RecX n=1 Tax=Mycobacteroides abscessus subsp. abscessus TaxID=1185650 RepID=A0AB38D133_9MYCO|nr:Uncharacterised protein [Mycobacteroides abscessus subsp. abscessus]SKV07216.1 Uncharacterised protein [Mycobacteroides abscessus subsp. bolletii]SIA13670.1 Uncharacterised protein [Mycobacteroides abscessus subsp. abscessus]SIB13124.1 Uncharacterised protein [Mycobacteroides abscessus subsp. abscessus]SIB15828.1 Uncharacterised protein [Mycobacteroides abscessus subsp. abscessus]